ncbi:MAG: universal stress protein [Bacteroidota bacterium]|nr:universal stress protein [Bacteroidota bacterium]
MYKFERILCPTDFSSASIEAVQFAASAVERFNGRISLLYVDEFEMTPQGYYFSDEEKQEHRKKVELFANQKFIDIIDKNQIDKTKTEMLIRYGTAYQEIITEAETKEYSAVAISIHGIGCSSPHLIGRTTERIIRLSRAPVLTIRPKNATQKVEIKTILCPTDFSEYSNYALPYAISVARYHSAKLILLHVTGLETEHSERLLERFPDPKFYHPNADEVVIERLVDKDIQPENSIVRVAQEYQIDMIVIGTHGARGLYRVQIGNTTEEVIRRTDVPTLSITHPVHKIVFPHRFSKE